MSAPLIAWGFALASIGFTLYGAPEVGLFLAFASALALVASGLDSRERRDARRRNRR